MARPSGGTWDAIIDVLATGSIDTPGEGRDVRRLGERAPLRHLRFIDASTPSE